jgi:NAD(P)-dependent dehydrogenase (short-subunit alcohol dehydrogenase family)
MAMAEGKKVALVTGVSSGIGRETALLLVESGFQVFGSTRRDDSGLDLPGVRRITLDVTEDASVARAVGAILSETGRIDALINNAGYALIGSIEESSLAEAKAQFETNFFGVMRLVGAVLPQMRRRGAGRIVNISSVLGFLPAPYLGIYGATKHAIEGYTETLDHEIRRFGIRALLVEPTFTKTNFGTHGMTVRNSLDAYSDEKKTVTAIIQRNIENGTDPRAVAKTVLRALTDRSPRLRYPVAEGRQLALLRRLIPPAFFDGTFRKQFGLADVKPRG